MAKIIIEIPDRFIDGADGTFVDVVRDALEFMEIPYNSIEEVEP